jgi:hypothetical protein
MFLAEYLTNLFECSAETLNFEYTEDNLIKELRSMALEQANPTPGESTETPKPSNSSKRKMYYDPRTQILDSDDDDIEIEAKQDQEFFQSVDERIHDNAERPVYIRDCISYLEDKEDCVKTMVALETLPQLIKKNATSIIDIEDELLERILFLENRFSLPGFMVFYF